MALDAEFKRDKVSVFAYLTLSIYAFDLYIFGPVLALLQSRLDMSYATISIASALWAAGATISGISFTFLVNKLGRYLLLWICVAFTGFGSILLGQAYSLVAVFVSAIMLGTAGTMLQIITSVLLSDHHGKRREKALVEANIGAGVSSIAAPLILALLGQSQFGWRLSMVLPAIGLGCLFLFFRHIELPKVPSSPKDPNNNKRKSLPLDFWFFAVLVSLGVAVEFCVVYFGAELLITTTKISTSAAVDSLSLFYGGILLGRIMGSNLTRRHGRAVLLVAWSLVLTMVSFLVFWLSTQAVVALSGLFFLGVGISNLFPLTLSLSLATATDQSNSANAKIQILAGLIVLIAPVVLGNLADRVGLKEAFLVEPILILVSILFLKVGLVKQNLRLRN